MSDSSIIFRPQFHCEQVSKFPDREKKVGDFSSQPKRFHLTDGRIPFEPARRLCALVGGAHGAVLSALRSSAPRRMTAAAASGSSGDQGRSGRCLPDTCQEIGQLTAR